MALLDRVRECRLFDRSHYRPFVVAGVEVGLVRSETAELLLEYREAFIVSRDRVSVADSLASFEERTRGVGEVLDDLAKRGALMGWRDEPYPVAAEIGDPPLMWMERCAIPLFGVRAAGIHVNGITRGARGPSMWIGRRSLAKSNSPGKLDQMVAGGKSAHHTVFETLVKESDEEASISVELSRSARSVGAIRYCTQRDEGLRRDTIFLFDLELPQSFIPQNRDGEISEFMLWPLERIVETVEFTQEFKFNCSLVVIDFLLRNGAIAADHPDYLALVAGLHQD